MSIDVRHVGQLAYEAYADAVNWAAYDGKKIAAWADQAEDRCAGWIAAGEAATEAAKVSIAACLIGTIPAGRRAAAMAQLARSVEQLGNSVELTPATAAAPLGVLPAPAPSCCREVPLCSTGAEPPAAGSAVVP